MHIKAKVEAIQVDKVNGSDHSKADDLLAVEEPLEIRLGMGPMENRVQKKLAVTMRTPGDDLELTLGFLITEGIIHDQNDLLSIKHCYDVDKEENWGNVVRAELKPHIIVEETHLDRNFYVSSSCGICGKASIESIQATGCKSLPDDTIVVSPDFIHQLPDSLRKTQSVFEHTGGIHAAALFDTGGHLLFIREDIGRHNAVDKVIGAAVQTGFFPMHDLIMMVSGRAGFELVQKSVMAGISMMAAVGAPSSLAVSLADSFNMTLLGFVRGNRFNIYTGNQRIGPTT